MSRTIGIISDTHEPYCIEGYREFCYDTFNTFSVDEIIHIGDEVDNAAISYHEKQLGMDSATTEMEKAMKEMKKWYKTFPDVRVCVGNHSALPFRQATTAGIPTRMMRTYEEMWEAPDGWTWDMQYDIDNVLYTHGTGASGQNGSRNLAISNRQSTVVGHSHSFGGVCYMASYQSLIFGLNVGCGIDWKHLAFSYGKNFPKKPTIGCGIVVDDGRTGLFIPMDLGSKITVNGI